VPENGSVAQQGSTSRLHNHRGNGFAVKLPDRNTASEFHDRIGDFQRYVLNLSSKFLAVPATQIPLEINTRLREVAEFWGFSQIFLMILSEGGRKLETVNGYSAPGGIPVPPGVESAKVPWLMDILRKGQPKAMARVSDEVPTWAVSDRSEVGRLGIKSALILPFIVGGEVQGGLFLNSLRQYREYPDELVVEFRHLGQFLAGALERFKAFEQASSAMRFDRLLSEISATYINLSWLSAPVSMGGLIVGALVVATTHTHRSWPEQLIPRLRLFGEIFANAIRRKEQDESLKFAFNEIQNLKKQIEADYVYLRDELTLEHNYEDIIGRSEGIRAVLLKVEQVAPTDVTTLIMGETGTGKELIARAIHHTSRRSSRPLIKVNCATLAPNLIESDLFGHEKGAFTGAEKRRVGRFELAHGASLFLDEIGELPLELQPKLLRVLQEGEFERLGGSRTIKVDVRIIAATNRNLEQLVEDGRFRSDLWYRLNSFPVFLPPLRERPEDIPLFVTHFVNHYCSKVGKRFDKIPRKIIEQLRSYSWPGNIREMDNIISRAVIISEEGKLQVQLPDSPRSREAGQKSLREMEKTFILQTLEDSDWKIEGKAGAAVKLDLRPSTLRNKMKKLGIRRPAA
jgi:formate hydrogenlyase transcriptional activator